MGKPTICLGENKGADQLCSNCEADQRLCFRYSDSQFLFYLNPKFQNSRLQATGLPDHVRIAIILKPGPSCSKLTTSLVNVSLKFQTLILQIHCYFLLKKCENPLHCKGFSHFFNKK